MANKLPSTKYVTFSEALSWLAFGNAQKRASLNKELADQAFGMPYICIKMMRRSRAVLFLTGEFYAHPAARRPRGDPARHQK
jgi:hypothetical protein